MTALRDRRTIAIITVCVCFISLRSIIISGLKALFFSNIGVAGTGTFILVVSCHNVVFVGLLGFCMVEVNLYELTICSTGGLGLASRVATLETFAPSSGAAARGSIPSLALQYEQKHWQKPVPFAH